MASASKNRHAAQILLYLARQRDQGLDVSELQPQDLSVHVLHRVEHCLGVWGGVCRLFGRRPPPRRKARLSST